MQSVSQVKCVQASEQSLEYRVEEKVYVCRHNNILPVWKNSCCYSQQAFSQSIMPSFSE